MGKDASEIQRQIDQTRSRLDETAEALQYKADLPSRLKDGVSERLETVRGTVADVAGSLKQTVSGAAGGLQQTVAGARQNVAGAAGNLPDPATIAGAARRGYGAVAENPLGLALGALAVGFLAGLLLPVTEYERRTVGPIRDDLVDRAQTIGADAVEHGKAVIQQTAQATLETAQRSFQEHGHRALDEGLSQRGLSGTVIEHGRAILEETARTAADTARQAAIEHGRQVVSEAKGEAAHGQDSTHNGAAGGSGGGQEAPGTTGTPSA
jgi:hypothetical protein